MKGPKEKEIVNDIRLFLRRMHIFHWKVFTGPTNLPGVSDILGITKRNQMYRCQHCGRPNEIITPGIFTAIEVKRDGLGPTELQQAFIDRIKAAGGIAFVARSVDDVITGFGLWDKFK